MPFRYCVLYTQALKQYDVYRVLRRSMPEGRGTVFYPCAELWWNDTVNTVIRPLFPGYVFIRSDMDREELHGLLRARRREILSFIRELKLAERRSAGEDPFDGEEDILIDLKDDEADFFDFLLNFRYEGKVSTAKIPEEGVIGMSRGYCEDGRYVVMEGPLKGHEKRIVDVDLRKRKAYLNIKVNGHIAKAGLEIYGKRYWFPDDKYAADILDDGTEVNPKGIAASMMGGGIGAENVR